MINSKAQISIYFLFTILAMVILLSVFVLQITKMNALKNNLETKENIKETNYLIAALNSEKKANTNEPNYGPYTSGSDANLSSHYR